MKRLVITIISIILLTNIVFAEEVLLRPNYQPKNQSDKGIIKYNKATQLNRPMIIFFYVDWCSSCKHYRPVFITFANTNQKPIIYSEMNCESSEYTKKIDKIFKIEEYPSIYLFDPTTNVKKKLQSLRNLNYEIDKFLTN